MKIVRMRQPYGAVNAGETCGFADHIADKLIADGKAKFLRDAPDKRVVSVAPSAAKPAPVVPPAKTSDKPEVKTDETKATDKPEEKPSETGTRTGAPGAGQKPAAVAPKAAAAKS